MDTVGINSVTLWKMALSIRKEAMEKATQEYNSYVAEIRKKIMKDSSQRHTLPVLYARQLMITMILWIIITIKMILHLKPYLRWFRIALILG